VEKRELKENGYRCNGKGSEHGGQILIRMVILTVDEIL
jgi:hypothetical protein